MERQRSDRLDTPKPPLFCNATVIRPVRCLLNGPSNAVLWMLPPNAKKPIVRRSPILSAASVRKKSPTVYSLELTVLIFERPCIAGFKTSSKA